MKKFSGLIAWLMLVFLLMGTIACSLTSFNQPVPGNPDQAPEQPQFQEQPQEPVSPPEPQNPPEPQPFDPPPAGPLQEPPMDGSPQEEPVQPPPNSESERGVIFGWVYIDSNQNLQHDNGEPSPGAGSIMPVYQGACPSPDQAASSQVDGDGYYRIENLIPGPYCVGGEKTVNLGPGDEVEVSFPFPP